MAGFVFTDGGVFMSSKELRSTTVVQQRQISVYFVAIVAAIGGLLFGYDTGVISGALLFLKVSFSLNDTTQEIAVSVALVGAIIGALSAGRVNDALGRKVTLLILAMIFTIGALLTAISPNLLSFIMCRILVGVGIGAAASVVPVYISEMAPPRLRGTLVTFNQLAVTVGIAISYWVDLAFAHMGWPPMFATAAIPGALLFLGMLVSPETPRWLASKGRWNEARQVLEQIKGLDPEKELVDVRGSLLAEQRRGGIHELLQPGLRTALMIGIGLAIFQQLVGINTVIYYAPIIFQKAGFVSANSAILATNVVGIVNVFSTIVATFLLDKLGRRTLLLIGTTIMVVALDALGLIFANGSGQISSLTLMTLIIYIFAFAISMGPVFWLMSAEIFPTRVRAAGSSICCFSNWVANLLVSLTFLSLLRLLGSSLTFGLYALMGILALVFCWLLVPETNGRTLEQIEHYWQRKRVT
jgi:SP family galactose:H+ symporter-like MFS transporter